MFKSTPMQPILLQFAISARLQPELLEEDVEVELLPDELEELEEDDGHEHEH